MFSSVNFDKACSDLGQFEQWWRWCKYTADKLSHTQQRHRCCAQANRRFLINVATCTCLLMWLPLLDEMLIPFRIADPNIFTTVISNHLWPNKPSITNHLSETLTPSFISIFRLWFDTSLSLFWKLPQDVLARNPQFLLGLLLLWFSSFLVDFFRLLFTILGLVGVCGRTFHVQAPKSLGGQPHFQLLCGGGV